jgi:nucleotide-binding universal stress UspA family protein
VTVVCGTDFSEASAEAVDAAAALAGAWKEELVLVHALEVPGAEEAGAWSPLESERKRAESKLGAEVARLGKSPIPTRTEVGIGASDVELLRIGASSGARLIVVGALGLRGGSLWGLGSTADRVAQTSPLPVLVVRDAKSIASWARGGRTLEILVGVDQTPSSDAAVRWTEELESAGRCRVTCGHVFWPPEVKDKLHAKGAIPIGSGHSEIEKALAVDLRGRIEALRKHRPFDLRLVGGLGRPADHLVALATDAKADVVVVGAHQRTLISRVWHGSVSRGVIDQAPMNVVCVTDRGQS